MILQRFKVNNFKTAKFEFIPENEGFKTEWDTAAGIWDLPLELKEGNKGIQPIVLG